MEDDKVLHLTRKRLENIYQQFLKNQSLEQLAIRLIEKNVEFYLEQLQSLPGTLRDKILQEMLKRKCPEGTGNTVEFQLLTKVFPLLLSPRTNSIGLNGLLSFCPDRFQNESIKLVTPHCIRLLEEISNVATNLKSLTIKRNHAFQMHICPERIDPQMLGALNKMQHLTRLFVEPYSFKVQEIFDLCKNNPNLQYVNVRLGYVGASQYPSADVLKESLSNVKEFIFQSEYLPHDSKCWLRLMCIENLPNLEIVHFYSDVNDVLKYRRGSLQRPLGFASKLKHLYIDLDRSKFTLDSLLPSFPNVTHLMVDWCGDRRDQPTFEQNVQPLFQFEKLKCVNVGNFAKCKAPLFKRLCQTYGPRLHTLCVSNEKVCGLDLKIVVSHCRALHKLALQNIRFFYNEMPTEPIAALRELEWKFTNVEAYPDDDLVPEMNLSYILSSPELEKVELVGIRFDLDDLKAVSGMIERRQILQNLRTFDFHFCWIERWGMGQTFEAVANVVKSASARLPQLKNIKFASNCSCEYYDGFGLSANRTRYAYQYYYKDPFLIYENVGNDQRIKDDCVLEILDLWGRPQRSGAAPSGQQRRRQAERRRRRPCFDSAR